MSTAPSSNKYQIKFLEEEIGLFDRKLAHLLKFENFSSDADRKAAAGRLSVKRDRLVRAVNELIDPTVAPAATPAAEIKKAKAPAKPRAPRKAKVATETAASAVTEETLAPVAAEEPIAVEETVALAEESLSAPRQPSPYAGTSLDYEHGLESYLQTRRKPS